MNVPWWRLLLSGDVDPKSLRRSTDRPAFVDRDHDDVGPEDQTVVVVRDQDRSLMPDRPVKPEVPWTDRDRRPLLPEALKQPADALKFWAWNAYYVVAFHVIRSPKYLGQNVLWSFRGTGRLLTLLVRYVRVHEHRDVLWSEADKALTSRDEGTYNSYFRHVGQVRDQARGRWAVLAFGTVGTGVLVLWAVQALGTTVLLVLGTIFGLGWSGRPMDRPYIESAVVSAPKARKITADQVIRALYKAGLVKETSDEQPEITGGQWGRVDDGWGGVVDLPGGKTAEQAIALKKQIASALKVDEFRLFMEQVRGQQGHAGLVRIWIADRDPHTREPLVSPLLKAEKFDLWRPVPFGRDERGRLVSFLLVWTSVLIGALPRIGKTNAVRLLVAAVALDVYSRLLIFDGKGGADLAPAELVAHAFGAGADDDVAKALAAALRDLKADMRRRYKVIRSLPRERVPKGKLTPALARDRDLDMPLVVVVIDEFQEYLENRTYGVEIEELLTTLVKLGPAAGIIVILSTQRPSSRTMKTDLRDVLGTRFGMMVTTREFSEMILGSGAYKLGLDASKFLKEHLGVGILRGTDDGELAGVGARTVHTHLMDIPEFEVVCKRARALREGAGTLSGVAAGEAAEALSDRILEHVAQAFRNEDKAHSITLCYRLAQDRPELYERWGQNDLATALGRYSIKAGNQTWARLLKQDATGHWYESDESGNRKGFELRQIIDALAERVGEVPDFPPEDLD